MKAKKDLKPPAPLKPEDVCDAVLAFIDKHLAQLPLDDQKDILEDVEAEITERITFIEATQDEERPEVDFGGEDDDENDEGDASEAFAEESDGE